MQDALMTPSDAARLLRGLGVDIGAAAVKWHSDNGNLPSERTAGGTRLYRREDLEAFATARTAARRKAGRRG